MRETALLMIQDPTVMGVDIQNAHPSEAVEAFVLYLQSHVINPLVARVGQNDPVSVAYESFMEALDNGDLGVLSQLTNELLRTIAATGITVPVVAIAVQKDLTGSPGSSYSALRRGSGHPADSDPRRTRAIRVQRQLLGLVHGRVDRSQGRASPRRGIHGRGCLRRGDRLRDQGRGPHPGDEARDRPGSLRRGVRRRRRVELRAAAVVHHRIGWIPSGRHAGASRSIREDNQRCHSAF